MVNNIKKLTAFTLTLLLLSGTTLLVTATVIKTKEENNHEWTLMLYCGGDEDPPIIGSQALISTLESISYNSNDNINVVALVDYGEAFLGELQKNENTGKYDFVKIESYDEISMSNYKTVKDFLEYSKANYPANRYFLQIVGHASAFFGLCYDNEIIEDPSDETPEYLTLKELKNAVSETNNVDILATTGCLMGTLECIYELKDCTEVYIASEEKYDVQLVPVTVLKDLNIFLNYYSESNYEISERIVEEIGNSILASPYFTLSAIRTDKIDALIISLNSYASYGIYNMEKYQDKFVNSRYQADGFPKGSQYLADLYDFVDLTVKKSKSKSCMKLLSSGLESYANPLKNSIEDAVIKEIHKSGHRNSHGISIFFPFEYDGSYDNDFLNLDFLDDTEWDEFLKELYQIETMFSKSPIFKNLMLFQQIIKKLVISLLDL